MDPIRHNYADHLENRIETLIHHMDPRDQTDRAILDRLLFDLADHLQAVTILFKVPAHDL